MKILLAAVLATALFGCGGDTPSGSTSAVTETDPTAANGLWRQHAIESYRVTLGRNCFCLPRGAIVLTISKGELVDSLVVEDNRRLTAEEIAFLPVTIEQVFDLIDTSRASGEPVTVEYDSTYGFPTRVAINEEALAYDGGAVYHLTDFVPQQ